MKKSPLLEICVETLDAALAAERGGADRIELCEDLRSGGITPATDLMRVVRAQVRIPIFVMIRPHCGDFCYSPEALERMVRSLTTAKEFGMDGVVLGLLHADRRVDVERTRGLVELARPLPVTFHRAFDAVADSFTALEDVIATGAARILTSGGAASAEEGTEVLTELVRLARGRISILPGGGIHPENLARIVRLTRAEEVHSGLSTVLPYPRTQCSAFEAGVRALAQVLDQEFNPTKSAP
jgi:copper homeostasis protein